MENKDTLPKFLERHQSDGRLMAVSAIGELWARQQSLLNENELLKQALAGYAEYMEKMDERLIKLEPKIQIVSEHEAKNFLKG